MTAFLRACLLALAALAFAPSGAQAFWYPLADDPMTGSLERLPNCGDPALAEAIVARFNRAETTYWNGRHMMSGVTGMRQAGFHPARDDKVARRWCEGRAVFADGQRRRLVIELSSNTGLLGLLPGFATCVEGLDRLWAYQPNCRVLRHREF